MSSTSDLQGRRLDALRAWSAFVEHGDGAEPLVRPEILRSWQRSQALGVRGRRRGAPRRRVRGACLLGRLAPAAGGVPRRGRAAPYRRGRRPRARDHRPPDPRPVDVRRAGHAPQGRVGELRPRRPLGRRVGRHQRARPRQPAQPAEHGVQRRALRTHRAQLGVLGRARARPGDRRPARCRRPLDHLGPHPPDRPGHRPGAGPPDRDRDAAVGDASGAAGRRRRHRAPARACSATPRPRSTASACCSTAARPRSSRSWPSTPTGSPSTASTRWSTATSRSPSPRSRPRCRTSGPRSAASWPLAPTG